MKGTDMKQYVNKSLVVFGPAGSGKTKFGEVIARRMELARIEDGYSSFSSKPMLTHGVLYLTADTDVVALAMSKGIDLIDIRVAKTLVRRPTPSKRREFKEVGMKMFESQVEVGATACIVRPSGKVVPMEREVYLKGDWDMSKVGQVFTDGEVAK